MKDFRASGRRDNKRTTVRHPPPRVTSIPKINSVSSDNFINLSKNIRTSVSKFVCLFTCLFIYLFTCLFVYLLSSLTGTWFTRSQLALSGKYSIYNFFIFSHLLLLITFLRNNHVTKLFTVIWGVHHIQRGPTSIQPCPRVSCSSARTPGR